MSVSTKSQLLDGNLEPQEERIIRAGAILKCQNSSVVEISGGVSQ
jgi:hypothetical protein